MKFDIAFHEKVLANWMTLRDPLCAELDRLQGQLQRLDDGIAARRRQILEARRRKLEKFDAIRFHRDRQGRVK